MAARVRSGHSFLLSMGHHQAKEKTPDGDITHAAGDGRCCTSRPAKRMTSPDISLSSPTRADGEIMAPPQLAAWSARESSGESASQPVSHSLGLELHSALSKLATNETESDLPSGPLPHPGR